MIYNLRFSECVFHIDPIRCAFKKVAFTFNSCNGILVVFYL